MNSLFQIVEINPIEELPFRLLVSLETQSVVAPYGNINKFFAGFNKERRRQVKEEISQHFGDSSPGYCRNSQYMVPYNCNTGCIKLNKYNYCTVCNKAVNLTKPIFGHVQKCLKELRGLELDRNSIKNYYFLIEGFTFRCKNGTSSVLKVPVFEDTEPTIPMLEAQITDLFIKHTKLDRMLRDHENSEHREGWVYEKDPDLVGHMLSYTYKERDFFRGTSHAIIAYGHLSHSPYHRDKEALELYGRNCCSLVQLLAKARADLKEAVDAGDIDKFGSIIFKDFVSEEPTLDTELNVALEHTMLRTPNSFHSTHRRQALFKSFTALLDFILFDNLDTTAIRAQSDDDILKFDRCIDSFVALKSLQYATHETIPKYVIRSNRDGTYVSSGAVHSIGNYKILLRAMMLEYQELLESNLPPDFTNTDEAFSTFSLNAVEDHQRQSDYYSVFRSLKFKDDSARRIANFTVSKFAGIQLRTLAKLSVILFWIIYYTVGPAYRATELLSLQFSSYHTGPRSLHWDEDLKTFRLTIHHNKINSLTRKYQQITKIVPTEVAKYIAHYLLVIRPLMRHIALIEYSNPEFKDTMYNHLLHSMVFVSATGTLNGDTCISYLKKESKAVLGCDYTISDSRHVLCSMINRIMRESSSSLETISKEMAGHSEQTDVTIYGMSGEGNISVTDKQIFVCEEWHRWLLLMEVRKDLPPHVNYVKLLKEHRLDPTVMIDEMLAAGRVLFNKDFEFNSTHHTFAILDIVNNQRSIACLYPTGSGKSLLYLVPVVIERQRNVRAITVVIIPFKSLLHDACEGAKNTRISAEIYHPGNVNIQFYADIEVLFVQLEYFRNFADFMPTLNQETSPRFVRRIVLDECHTFHSEREFRPAFREVLSLLKGKYCFLFLSATLTQECFHFLCGHFTLDIIQYGESCIKKNIVHIGLDTRNQEKAVKYVASKLSNGKLLVLLNNKPKGEQLVARLKGEGMAINAYNADTDLEGEGAALEVYNRFDRGLDNVLVATTAFCHGLNIKNITHILIIGDNIDWVIYQQFSGRLNRGDLQATGHVYYDRTLADNYADKCINLNLLQAFEGKSNSCHQMGAVKCSVCDEDLEIAELRAYASFDAGGWLSERSHENEEHSEQDEVVEEGIDELIPSEQDVFDDFDEDIFTQNQSSASESLIIHSSPIHRAPLQSNAATLPSPITPVHRAPLQSNAATLPSPMTPQELAKRTYTQAFRNVPDRQESNFPTEESVNALLVLVGADKKYLKYPIRHKSLLVSNLHTFTYSLYDVEIPRLRCRSCGLLTEEAIGLNAVHDTSTELQCMLLHESALAYFVNPGEVHKGNFTYLLEMIKGIRAKSRVVKGLFVDDSLLKKYLSSSHPREYIRSYQDLLRLNKYWNQSKVIEFCNQYIGPRPPAPMTNICKFLYKKYRAMGGGVCSVCGLMNNDDFHKAYCHTRDLALYLCVYLFHHKNRLKKFCTAYDVDYPLSLILFADMVLGLPVEAVARAAFERKVPHPQAYTNRSKLFEFALSLQRL